jgi:glycosyltransferase involved in cell wall biosynthesis
MSKTIVISLCSTLDPLSGHGLRATRIAKSLAKTGYQVKLIGFSCHPIDATAEAFRKEFQQLSSRISTIPLELEEKQYKLFEEYFSNTYMEIVRAFRLLPATFEYNLLIERIKPSILTICSGHPIFRFSSNILNSAKLVIDLQDILFETAAYMRGWSTKHLFSIVLRILEVSQLKSSEGIITVSWSIANYLQNLLKGKKIIVCPNAPSINELLSLDVMLDVDNTPLVNYVKNSSKIKLVYLGKLEPRIRGLEELCKAIAELPQRIKEKFLFIFIGDGILKTYIQNYLSSNDVNVILPGRLQRREALTVAKFCDAALLPYPITKLINIQGALPSKLFEYVYLGLPIIMPRLPDSLRVAGSLAVCYNNITELKQILSNFYDFCFVDERAREEAKKRLLREYTWDAFEKKLIEFYEKLIQS